MNLLKRREDRMEYEHIGRLTDEEFRRLTGVKKPVFEEMAAIIRDAEDLRRLNGGPKRRFSAEDQVLIMLEYWREYRTQFHMAGSRGVSESLIHKTIMECENALIRSGKFTLPGKKALLKSDMQYEVVLIDASESPVERPKKNSGSGTPARRSGTRKRPSSSSTKKRGRSSASRMKKDDRTTSAF